jgi:hypothetical protein
VTLVVELVGGPGCGTRQTFPDPYHLADGGSSTVPRRITYTADGTVYGVRTHDGRLVVTSDRLAVVYTPLRT